MTTRKLERVIPSIPASDGAGVKLRRSLGACFDPYFFTLGEQTRRASRDGLARLADERLALVHI